LRQVTATIDLMTIEGTSLVHAEWRYSDTRIIEVDFTGPGADGQPTGKPVKIAPRQRNRFRRFDLGANQSVFP
jgi:hypothetical protein